MDILVVGGGGREHAICATLKKSRRLGALYCAPGNGGISQIASCADIKATEIENMVRFALDRRVDMVVVAPDDPLALGMVDAMEAAGIRAFGPRKNAAIIESSKIFSKNLMKKHGIPTADFKVFHDKDEAVKHIRKQGAPIVVKADGLALGKGVTVATDVTEAVEAVNSMMLDMKFGESGSRIVVEEHMTGPEVTVLAFTDGSTIVPMLSSQDHKRAYTGNLGPNTGGMGAICPSPNYTDDVAKACMESIYRPTIDAMRSEGRLFKGVIYFGLMLTPSGPRVVEYNARFGDPEAQAVLSLLDTDLADIMDSVIDGKLDRQEIKWAKGSSCCVVMASGGYPGEYEKGHAITGLDRVPGDITVFHSGTALKDGELVTNGGRVLGVTGIGADLAEASRRAYDGARLISFDGAYFRTDIGR